MFSDTIISEFTAPGRAAVSGIRISGKKAKLVTEKLFKIQLKETRRAYFVNSSIDNILVTWFKEPNTYTGEELIEIFCHGNEEIVKTIIDLYIKEGIRFAKRGEFTRRAFLNGKLDLLESEAVLNLINSNSIEEAKASKSVLDGKLGKKIDILEHYLSSIQENLEYDIDFNEEESPFDFQKEEQELKKHVLYFEGLLTNLKTHSNFEKINKIIFTGATNVGKSSIFNALLGFNRSIVSDIHGTTRDYVSEHSFIENYKVQFIDTAGIRETNEDIEKIGVQKSHQLRATKAIKILVIDNDEQSDIKNNDIVVRNKTDLLKNKSRNKKYIYTSVKTGEGIQKLKNAIMAIVAQNIDKLNGTFVVSKRVHDNVQNIVKDTNLLLLSIQEGRDLDILASINTKILRNIKRLKGKSENLDDLINGIFDKFCVGK